MLLNFILILFLWFAGIQLSAKDISVFFCKYNRKLTAGIILSLIAALLLVLTTIIDICAIGGRAICLFFVFFTVCLIYEWVIAKINPSNVYYAICLRLLLITLVYIYCIVSIRYACYTTYIIIGLWINNCPFGVVYRKKLIICSYYFPKKIEPEFEERNECNILPFLPDFSHAGNKVKTKYTIYNVCEYGILPDTNEDVLEKVQILIDRIGSKGGGCLFFPAGKYYFNKNKHKRNFLQINYSNICIEGELDCKGHILSEFILCNHTVRGHKNPWLSPFFITTGEKIQESNEFWGLQFRKKKNIITRSGSLSDPGSDGSILTPKFATNIIKDSKKGSDVIYVDDSSLLSKYILLGMYNTSPDGNLIKDIMGINNPHSEWGTFLRAGKEEAPSFQWLVQVAEIIDKHTIKLVQPLWTDCLLKYEPAIYNVDMLENVCIKNLKLKSLWNGLFRHHGFPVYYSVKQAQEMDYGWNAINMKRVAHSSVQNIEICDFVNPIFVMDSRNVSVENITIMGHDGHQGIKIYEHACDNLFRDITFYNEYADMMGGEGNAYGNVFTNVQYLNPLFKPTYFDFHGFSEGPFSPPAYNLFENIYGFSHIKTAGALYNQPGCGQYNVWYNVVSENERNGSPIFISLPYIPKKGIFKKISVLRHAFVKVMQRKSISLDYVKKVYNERMVEFDSLILDPQLHYKLFNKQYLIGYMSKSKVVNDKEKHVIAESYNKLCSPKSLYNYQLQKQ